MGNKLKKQIPVMHFNFILIQKISEQFGFLRLIIKSIYSGQSAEVFHLLQ